MRYVVVGNDHYTTLGVIRQIGLCGDIPTCLIVNNDRDVDIVSMSRFCDPLRLQRFDTPEDAISALDGVIEDDAYLVFTDDVTMHLAMTMNDGYTYQDLRDRFTMFGSDDPEALLNAMCKDGIYDIFSKLDLPVIKAGVSTDGSLPSGLKLPVVTKALKPFDGNRKARFDICKRKATLKNVYERFGEPLFVQQFVDKTNEVCIEGFSINNGNDVVADRMVKYLYNIEGYYSPYMTCEVLGSQDKAMIEMIAKEIMSSVGYNGVFDIEFIQVGDEYFFSEVNFRCTTWGWPVLATGLAITPSWAHSMKAGKINEVELPGDDKVTAMVEPIDYGIRVKSGMISEEEWKQQRDEAETFYDCFDDPLLGDVLRVKRDVFERLM